jgi:hypothetical protein
MPTRSSTDACRWWMQLSPPKHPSQSVCTATVERKPLLIRLDQSEQRHAQHEARPSHARAYTCRNPSEQTGPPCQSATITYQPKPSLLIRCSGGGVMTAGVEDGTAVLAGDGAQRAGDRPAANMEGALLVGESSVSCGPDRGGSVRLIMHCGRWLTGAASSRSPP